MDPATISLIFMGIRAVSQGLKAKGRRDRFLSELETFLVGIHAEGRTASAEEVMEYAGKAANANTAYQAQLALFLEAIGDGPPEVASVSSIPSGGAFGSGFGGGS